MHAEAFPHAPSGSARDPSSTAGELMEEGHLPVLAEEGLSSFQLADAERGFSFRSTGPLDMRFDTSRGVPASELLATLDAAELTALFRRFGEEPFAPRIARAIVAARREAPIETAQQLAELIEGGAPAPPRGRRRIHPATRAVPAPRVAANQGP